MAEVTEVVKDRVKFVMAQPLDIGVAATNGW